MAVVGLEALKVVLRVRLAGLISLTLWGNLILESRNCGNQRVSDENACEDSFEHKTDESSH